LVEDKKPGRKDYESDDPASRANVVIAIDTIDLFAPDTEGFVGEMEKKKIPVG
jgi:hypothetical protein